LIKKTVWRVELLFLLVRALFILFNHQHHHPLQSLSRHSKTWSKRKHTVVTRILKKEPGNAFLQEHPEFAVVRSRATLRRKIEDMIEEELVAAGLTKPKGGRKEEKAQKQA